ncbi:TonB-linked SusC/RagA family outer membrane protein [Dyadobacter jejuensis]|uniref:TonB-linked SusC/RagA family outer membrane protein n=1 Tax=Dyadobacter jejuensis TaxID=1082580 RepID=A0A316AKH7_9BACT|nr:TonB-dependent receptor [Dyadobacter jejuensis]PWJ57749.1 TonB-linked SusC/RagA family outer membrane protein [Dyadobacter jejuensis]
MQKTQRLQQLLWTMMKLTYYQLVLSVVFVGMVSATTIRAQDVLNQTITIRITNQKIKDALVILEKNSDIKFVYSSKMIDADRRVNLNVSKSSLKEVLEKVLVPLQLQYEVSGRQIVLEKAEKPKGTERIDPAPEQQTRSIKGKVTEEDGGVLPGVSVVLKGTQQGTITDTKGNFQLDVPDSDAVLVFSFVGYISQEIALGSQTTVNVKLKIDDKSLEEVVVIGYGTVNRKDLTGSVGQANVKDMQKAAVKSFDDALAGRVAGVNVSSSDGQPGSLPNIVIRGSNSLTQDNSPLYVVDGFPLESNDNNTINPAEIESIDILKDASSTAIYGARGANGVIMITTKKGKAGAPVVSYDGYVGIQRDIKRIPSMSPYEFVKLQLERAPTESNDRYLIDPEMTLEDYRNVEKVDWYEKSLQAAPMQNHSISVRGGNPNSKYSVSTSYFDQKGIFINTGFRRWQGRFTLDQQINNRLSFGINTNYSDTKSYGLVAAQGGGSAGIIYSIWSYRPVFPEPNVNLDVDVLDPAVNPAQDYRINPYIQLTNTHRENFSNSLMSSGYMSYTLAAGLKLRVTGGLNRATYRYDNFYNSNTATGNIASPSYKGINGNQSMTTSTSLSNENTLTWTKKFNKNHNLNVVGGFTQQMGKYERFGATVVMITNEDLGMNALDEGAPTRVDASSSLWRLNSFLGRVNYTFKSRYLLTASMRADGSSKLAPENRWGYFPSAAFAYRLSDEPFMKKIGLVNDAKVRLSYGATGNNRVSDFAYMSSISSSYNDYSFGNATPSAGSRATALGNAALKWETTNQFNAGIDLAILKNRISFTGDIYHKKTKDLLLNAQIPYTSGYTATYKNIGSVSNSGLELTLNTTNIQSEKFTWNSSFNISFNRNKVLALTDNQESMTSVIGSTASGYSVTPIYIAKIGQPIAMLYGLLSDGLYGYDDFNQLTNGNYILKDDVPTNGNARASIKPGDAKFRDLNGDLEVNSADLTIIGNPNPDFIGGFNNNFMYHNFDLNVFFQFSVGNDAFNANRNQFEGGAYTVGNTNYYATYANRWTEENPDGIYPRINGQGTTAGYGSRYVEDASYLRFKTVSLGYNFPTSRLAARKIKSLRLYCTAQNLFTWTRYTGMDPEVSTRNSALTPGFDYSPYPRAKSIVLGLNVSF